MLRWKQCSSWIQSSFVISNSLNLVSRQLIASFMRSTLTAAIHHAVVVNIEHYLQEIDHLRRLFQTWRDTKTTTSPNPNEVPKLTLSDITCLSQDSPVEKPSHPSESHTTQHQETHATIHVPRTSELTPKPLHQPKQSPRVTTATQSPPGFRWRPIQLHQSKRL